MTASWTNGDAPTASKFNNPTLTSVIFAENITKSSSPSIGEVWWNSTEKYLEYYDGSNWILLL